MPFVRCPARRAPLVRQDRVHPASGRGAHPGRRPAPGRAAPGLVRPVALLPGPTLVYPWVDGEVLNAATTRGSDRAALARFRQLPVGAVEHALDRILDAHRAIAAAGWVSVDLYDGCFLHDFDAGRMHLIDLDEYRPGPFVLGADRLPGSGAYMAPEEWVPGAVIDERTMVFTLGRTLHHLLDSPAGWRGRRAQAAVIARATDPAPGRRHPGVDVLARDWRAA